MVEYARKDYSDSPGIFFPILGAMSLSELDNMIPLQLDLEATDGDWNTFFHYLGRENELLKGHISFAIKNKFEHLLSHKNRHGHTPFSIPSASARDTRKDRLVLQSYFEQAVLPGIMRKSSQSTASGKTSAPRARARM